MAKNLTRSWFVPHDLPEIMRSREYRQVDRQEAVQAFVEVESVTNRLGGNVIVTTEAVEIEPGRYVVIGYGFQWLPFATAKKQRDEPVEDAEPELVGA